LQYKEGNSLDTTLEKIWALCKDAPITVDSFLEMRRRDNELEENQYRHLFSNGTNVLARFVIAVIQPVKIEAVITAIKIINNFRYNFLLRYIKTPLSTMTTCIYKAAPTSCFPEILREGAVFKVFALSGFKLHGCHLLSCLFSLSVQRKNQFQ
jgi:hypothetical protein